MEIKKLKENQVFVFGSNVAGKHGAGAARTAYIYFGAVYGQASGPTGQCYAIITKILPNTFYGWTRIQKQLVKLFAFAKKYPDVEFLLTDVGCGLAGGKREDLEAILETMDVPSNIIYTWKIVEND